jgi:hypothetical protein
MLPVDIRLLVLEAAVRDARRRWFIRQRLAVARLLEAAPRPLPTPWPHTLAVHLGRGPMCRVIYVNWHQTEEGEVHTEVTFRVFLQAARCGKAVRSLTHITWSRSAADDETELEYQFCGFIAGGKDTELAKLNAEAS